MATKKRLIDANAILLKLKSHHDLFINEWEGFSALSEKDKARVDEITQCMADIFNAPTVDAVEVVHGRWENVKETEVYSPDHGCTFTHTAETCSVCNIRSGFVGSKFYLYDAYCPNCGALMEDKNESVS